MTTTTTNTAADLAGRLVAERRAYAENAAEHTAEAREAERQTHYHRTAADDATAQSAAAGAELRDLVRALVNRDEAEPEEVTPDGTSWTRDVAAYRATFARGRVSTAARERGHAPRARAYGWTYYATTTDNANRSADIYEAPQGSNDPDKLQAQVSAAENALRVWAAEHTAAAWLDRHGIDPANAPDPVRLVAIDAAVMRRSDYHNGTAYTYFRPELRAMIAGAELEKLDPWSLPDPLRDRISAATGGNRRIDDPEQPTETEARAALAALVPEILAAYLDQRHRRHREP
jgi:hypothetical protein